MKKIGLNLKHFRNSILELSEFELLGGVKVQETSFEISIFKIALYDVWSTLGRGQNILGGPKVLFKGQNSVTQRQQETTAISISSFSFFLNVRDNVKKNGAHNSLGASFKIHVVCWPSWKHVH